MSTHLEWTGPPPDPQSANPIERIAAIAINCVGAEKNGNDMIEDLMRIADICIATLRGQGKRNLDLVRDAQAALNGNQLGIVKQRLSELEDNLVHGK